MNDADLQERMQLAIERISEIKEEDQTIWDTLAKMDAGAKNLKTYFDSVAEFILYVYDVYEIVSQPGKIDLPLSKLQEINHNLYADILPEHYDASFANPDYAVEKLGEYGKYLCMLYAEIRAMIAYAYEDEMQAMISLMELFLEVYGIFTASEGEKLPDEKEIKEAIYYYMYDYADVLVARRIRETVTCVNPFAYDIIMQSDLMTPDYLYAYGEYIGENELRMAQYLAKLPEEKIESLACTYVQGFIKGFETMRIDISPKKSVNIRYAIGQERMVKAAIQMFEKEGLASILFRYPVSRMNRKATIRTGYAATPANKQYEYDHAKITHEDIMLCNFTCFFITKMHIDLDWSCISCITFLAFFNRILDVFLTQLIINQFQTQIACVIDDWRNILKHFSQTFVKEPLI